MSAQTVPAMGTKIKADKNTFMKSLPFLKDVEGFLDDINLFFGRESGGMADLKPIVK